MDLSSSPVDFMYHVQASLDVEPAKVEDFSGAKTASLGFAYGKRRGSVSVRQHGVRQGKSHLHNGVTLVARLAKRRAWQLAFLSRGLKAAGGEHEVGQYHEG